MRHKFESVQPLRLNGFLSAPVPYGGLSHRFLNPEDAQMQFEGFADRVARAIENHQYLPIYRMADGEFAFILNWRRRATETSTLARLRGSLSRFYNNILHRRFATMWGEQYSGAERRIALQRLTDAMRFIADKGILAIYFAVRGDHWSEEFFEPLCDWLDRNGIAMTAGNYVPFYFVYALLTGPRRREVFEKRRVLVVTHSDPPRMEAITRGLREEGASEVHFQQISASRSMFDTLDPAQWKDRIDVAIVAGGIGSANILAQLSMLSVPCIDAGIVVECWIDPRRRFERPFLLDDARRQALTAT